MSTATTCGCIIKYKLQLHTSTHARCALVTMHLLMAQLSQPDHSAAYVWVQVFTYQQCCPAACVCSGCFLYQTKQPVMHVADVIPDKRSCSKRMLQASAPANNGVCIEVQRIQWQAPPGPSFMCWGGVMLKPNTGRSTGNSAASFCKLLAHWKGTEQDSQSAASRQQRDMESGHQSGQCMLCAAGLSGSLDTMPADWCNGWYTSQVNDCDHHHLRWVPAHGDK